MKRSILENLRNLDVNFRSFQSFSFLLKVMAILSSASIVPFLVYGHGVSGFALFSLATALVYTVASVDFGVANSINSTSKHDLVKVNQQFQLAKIIIILLPVVYLIVSALIYWLNSELLDLFIYFKLPYIFIGSYLAILNNLGLKLLLMNEKVRQYQFLQPVQQILSNIFILFTASQLSLERIFIASMVLANFTGGFMALVLILKHSHTLNLKSLSNTIRKNLASLVTFQYLQLLSIFNSQGIIMLISRFYSLQVVAIYSLSARIFQSVNQVYGQLIADYWNQISRLKFSGAKKSLYSQYITVVKRTIWYGSLVNGFILLVGPHIFREFLSLEYNFNLFLSLAFYWTCTLIFIPMSYTLNGLLYIRGQFVSQSMVTLANFCAITYFGLANITLSLSVLVIGVFISLLVLPFSHYLIKKYIATSQLGIAVIK